MDIKLYKNQWYVTYTKTKAQDTPYLVELKNHKGELVDKIRADKYQTAREYFKAFCKIAKTAQA